MSEIILDTALPLTCEQCEAPIEPGEKKFLFGLIVPEGENFVLPYCAKCARYGEMLFLDLKPI